LAPLADCADGLDSPVDAFSGATVDDDARARSRESLGREADSGGRSGDDGGFAGKINMHADSVTSLMVRNAEVLHPYDLQDWVKEFVLW
jgi:hypothetical protein